MTSEEIEDMLAKLQSQIMGSVDETLPYQEISDQEMTANFRIDENDTEQDQRT